MDREINETVQILSKADVINGFKQTKLGLVPNYWDEVLLKDIFEEVVEVTNDTEKFPLYSLTIENGVTPKTQRYERSFLITKESDNYKVVGKDEFVYNPMNLRFGALARLKEDKKVSVSGYYNIFRIRNQYSPEFIEYFLKSERMMYLYNSYATGTLIEKQRVHYSQFVNFKLPIPPEEEANKIGEILSTWDQAIEIKERQIGQKKEYKKGLMKKLLTGEVRLPGFEGEWKEVSLKRICKLETGKRPKGGVTTEGDVPSLGGENIYIEYGLNLSVVKKVSKDFYNNMTSGHLKENDILINKDGAQTGKVAIYKNSGLDNACVNEHLFIVRPEKGISYKYLYYYLASTEGQQKMNVRITSSAQPGLNSQFVNGYYFKIPAYEEQCLIGDILFDSDQEILLLKKEKEELIQQKKCLMQLLLTGKVRIKG